MKARHKRLLGTVLLGLALAGLAMCAALAISLLGPQRARVEQHPHTGSRGADAIVTLASLANAGGEGLGRAVTLISLIFLVCAVLLVAPLGLLLRRSGAEGPDTQDETGLS